jgi:hypothetical protein
MDVPSLFDADGPFFLVCFAVAQSAGYSAWPNWNIAYTPLSRLLFFPVS